MAENLKSTFSDDRISVIEINGMWFGIDILKSREVFQLPEITPVPNTERFVLGVFNLRGDIYPLIDVSTILGMNEKTILPSDMVVVLDNQNAVMGIISDRVHGVKSLDNVKIKPAHGVISKKMEEFISGIISEKNSEIYLLNVDRLFSSPALRTYA
jgi:purine-binding chemotaxis protein CheW